MGYDLYVCNPSDEVTASVERARREFDEAVNFRNSFERDSDEYDKAQERVSELFSLLSPIEAYFRFNIWGMATARRLMQEAGVDSDLIGLFASNDGMTVEPDGCEEIASLLRARYDTADPVKGFLNIIGDLSKGDLPTDFELGAAAAVMGLVDPSDLETERATVVTPNLLGHVPSVEELERRFKAGEIDDVTMKALAEARDWLDYILDFATFNEKAVAGEGYTVC